MREPLKLWIDHGHGGNEKGACHNGIIERDYVQDIAHRVVSIMLGAQAAQVVASTPFMCSGEPAWSLEQRAEWAKESGCNLAVSLHVNAHHSTWVKGFTGYYRTQDKAAMRDLLVSIDNRMPLALTRKAGYQTCFEAEVVNTKTKWKQRPLNVLKPYTKQGIPALLCELFYCSNTQNATVAKESATQVEIAFAIARGIHAWYTQRTV